MSQTSKGAVDWDGQVLTVSKTDSTKLFLSQSPDEEYRRHGEGILEDKCRHKQSA